MACKRQFESAKKTISRNQTYVLYPIFCALFSMFLCSITTPSLAAPDGWAATYGGSDFDNASSIQQTGDGGYIVAGETRSFDVGEVNVWVLKLRPDGTVDWQKSYECSEWDGLRSIQQTGDGGYIVAGDKSSFGVGNVDVWILKLRPGGSVEWQKTYGGGGFDSAFSIQQTGDGGYIVAGETGSFGVGAVDVWVLKLRRDGTVEWQRTYGRGDFDSAFSIQQTRDGGYIVAGCTHSFAFGNGDLMVLKLSPEGAVEWQKIYGRGSYERANAIRQTADGGYVVAGLTFGVGVEEIPDVWVLKLSPDGAVEWQKAYGGANFDEAHSIQQTGDGGYVVAGSTGYVTDTLGGISTSGGHAWVIKLRPDGTAEWRKAYGKGTFETANSIRQTSDGGYIVAGKTGSFGARDDDFWVLKLRPDGTIAPRCDFMWDTGMPGRDSNAAVLDSGLIVRDSDARPRRPSATVQDTHVPANILCASTVAE